LRPGDFDMVLDERDNARLCGYPCCAAPDLGPRHRIPLPPVCDRCIRIISSNRHHFSAFYML
jgi:hypothetical protein